MIDCTERTGEKVLVNIIAANIANNKITLVIINQLEPKVYKLKPTDSICENLTNIASVTINEKLKR